MTALRQELAREREYRGRKYSMNDLCVSKLGGNGVQARHTTDSGTLVIPRVPPPPPVPMMPSPNGLFRVPVPREEPQPERTVPATPVIEDNTVSEWVASVNAEPKPLDDDVARMEAEGGPDGHDDQ